MDVIFGKDSSRQEFVAAHLSGRGDRHGYYQEIVAPVIEAIARVIDRDGDGFIQAADYAVVFSSNGVDARIASAGFERLDADGDGRISVDELHTTAAQLFLSQDSADPGTSMLGPG